MKRPSPLADKTRLLSIESIRVIDELKSATRQYSMCDQLLRSVTAPGALVREAQDSESPRDMHHKIGIALKEAREAAYWIDLFITGCGIEEERFSTMSNLLNEVTAMLVASKKTLRQKF